MRSSSISAGGAVLAGDERLPRPVRAIVVLGLPPAPGPVDEILLLLVASIPFVLFGRALREARRRP